MNNKEINKLSKIHLYLEKRWVRGLILFPPLIIVIIVIISINSIINKLIISSYLLPILIISESYLMLGIIVILWSDYKRLIKYNNN